MAFTMMVVTFTKALSGAGFEEISHLLSLLIVFIALCYTGAGRYSLDNRLFRGKTVAFGSSNRLG